MARPTQSPARISRLRRRTVWVSRTAVNPLINPMTSIGASILFTRMLLQETNEHSAVEAVIATEQDAKDERRKRIGRDQPGGFRV